MSVKPLQRSELLGFSQGYISDANPLENIPNTTVAEQNFEMHKDGTRSRRLGLDLVGGVNNWHSQFTVPNAVTMPTRPKGAYLWEAAGGNIGVNFYVLQDGDRISFYRVTPSGSWFDSGALLHFGFGSQFPENGFVSMVAHQGKLVVAGNSTALTIFGFNTTTNTITTEFATIKIRDMFGIEDYAAREKDPGLATTYMTGPHYYNLYNQGWGIPRRLWFDPPQETLYDLVSHMQGGNGGLSNSDVVWDGMEYRPANATSLVSDYVFRAGLMKEKRGVRAKAAKGYFIIDAFYRGQSRREAWNAHKAKYPQTGNVVLPEFPNDITTGGVNSVASFAGRVFCSGARGSVTGGDARSPDYTNFVFFSQVTKSALDAGKCYQEGSPVSDSDADIVDTDGGFFTVAGASNIHTMIPQADRLFLFAENGVWAVVGGGDYGFSATNYRVEKISDSGMIPGRSSVVQNDTVSYWGWEGIYILTKNQYGDWEVRNLTRERHQNYYNSLPLDDKRSVSGIYDPYRNQIRWLYRSVNLEQDVFEYREFILDLNFQAFSINKFAVAPYQWFILHNLPPPKATNLTAELDYSRFQGAYVIGRWFASGSNYTIRQYIATLSDETHQDWYSTGSPRSEPAFMETRSFTGEAFTLKKQVPYLSVLFKNTVTNTSGGAIARPSSCIGTVKWEHSTLERSNRWSRPQELFRLPRFYMATGTDIYSGESVVQTKTKIRGSGKALSLRVEVTGTNSCHILGWGLHLTGNDVP